MRQVLLELCLFTNRMLLPAPTRVGRYPAAVGTRAEPTMLFGVRNETLLNTRV